MTQQRNLALALLHALGQRQRNGLAGVHERLPAEVRELARQQLVGQQAHRQAGSHCSAAKQQGQARSRGVQPAGHGGSQTYGIGKCGMQNASILSANPAPHGLRGALYCGEKPA